MATENESGTKRRRAEEPQQQGGSGGAAMQRKSTATTIAVDLKALDCTICFDPLKPPVFQCAVGHLVCASCHGKLLNKDKYHTCSIASGYNRCFAIEQLLQSALVPCSNARYGCTVETAYHGMEEHESKCPHTPCFYPEAGCGFSGSTALLLAHFTGTHKWPSTRLDHHQWIFCLDAVHEGMHVLHRKDCSAMILLKFTLTGPFGTIATVFCVEPHAAAKRNFICLVTAKDWQERTFFNLRSTTLSDGLPATECCFLVPSVSPAKILIYVSSLNENQRITMSTADQTAASYFGVGIDGASKASMLRSSPNGRIRCRLCDVSFRMFHFQFQDMLKETCL